jgi:hypothetical protein
MLSAWVAEGGLHCTLNIGMWEAQRQNEVRAWGILLADVVRHIANALNEERGMPSDKTADTVVDAMLEELGSPTSDPKGTFSPGHS